MSRQRSRSRFITTSLVQSKDSSGITPSAQRPLAATKARSGVAARSGQPERSAPDACSQRWRRINKWLRATAGLDRLEELWMQVHDHQVLPVRLRRGDRQSGAEGAIRALVRALRLCRVVSAPSRAGRSPYTSEPSIEASEAINRVGRIKPETPAKSGDPRPPRANHHRRALDARSYGPSRGPSGRATESWLKRPSNRRQPGQRQ
jgi:hypothetical protein